MAKPKKQDNDEIFLCDWARNDSPYYTEAHKKYRLFVREFVEKEITPNIERWERQQEIPHEFYKKCYNAGLYSTFYPKSLGGTPFIDKEHDHDPFMSLIFHEEMAAAGSGGLGSVWIHLICVTPVLVFGTPYLIKQALSVIKADKFACLCISEPTAGSDVRNISCTAKEDGDDFIVNGEKYWITGGVKADYFVTAVRTGGPGIKGISLLWIERGPGVITTRLPLQGHDTSATAYVVFKDVRVPKKNIIGKINEGFKPIMFNFNNERFGIICSAIAMSKLCVEEAARYAKTRETFGKTLIKHQVIRHKLAEMTRQVLATHSLAENVAYRMKMKPMSVDASLIKDISLLKVQASKTLEYCAREASQIFGGRAYVKGGRAAKVERVYRDVRAIAIYGGSEEIMLDLAVRQAKL